MKCFFFSRRKTTFLAEDDISGGLRSFFVFWTCSSGHSIMEKKPFTFFLSKFRTYERTDARTDAFAIYRLGCPKVSHRCHHKTLSEPDPTCGSGQGRNRNTLLAKAADQLGRRRIQNSGERACGVAPRTRHSRGTSQERQFCRPGSADQGSSNFMYFWPPLLSPAQYYSSAAQYCSVLLSTAPYCCCYSHCTFIIVLKVTGQNLFNSTS